MSLKIQREGISSAESALTEDKLYGMAYELEQMVGDEEITVRISELPNAARAEISFTYDGYLIRREDQRADVVECFAAAIRSALKHVRWLDAKTCDEGKQSPIVRTKELKLKPISREKAITEMQLVDHMFYMFHDVETGKICTIYARNSGGYGILIAD